MRIIASSEMGMTTQQVITASYKKCPRKMFRKTVNLGQYLEKLHTQYETGGNNTKFSMKVEKKLHGPMSATEHHAL